MPRAPGDILRPVRTPPQEIASYCEEVTPCISRPSRRSTSSDPEIAGLIHDEARRQAEKIRLIPSENYVSLAVLEACGTVLTNKYSEGYPGKRYYEGQQFIDPLETIAIERAKALFGADHANVQPYSGSPANLAVYLAFAKPGDTVMGMSLPMGGHLTHGAPGSATAASGSTPCSTACAARHRPDGHGRGARHRPARAAQDDHRGRHRDPAHDRLPGVRRDRRRSRTRCSSPTWRTSPA